MLPSSFFSSSPSISYPSSLYDVYPITPIDLLRRNVLRDMKLNLETSLPLLSINPYLLEPGFTLFLMESHENGF